MCGLCIRSGGTTLFLHNHPRKVLGDVTGIAEPSQTEAGKYKHSKHKTTLPVKKGPKMTKATKDELRRREEKSKSEYELKIDAFQKTMDSLKADSGELRDKIRNMESRANCQDQYIMCLEKRFVNLCDQCKLKGEETAFTPAESYRLQRIWELLEKQEQRQTAASAPLATEGSCQAAGNSSISARETRTEPL